MQPTIRTAEPADHPAIYRLGARLEVGVAPWRPVGMVRASINGWISGTLADDFDGRVLVAEIDGVVAGFVSVSSTTHFTGQVDAYIGELAVDVDHEGGGVGSALVGAAIDAAIDMGHHRITLTTGAANQRAIGFYERHGFDHEEVTLTRPLSRTVSAGGNS